jgi:hypothetical protein
MAEHGFCGVFGKMISEGKLATICEEHEPLARRPRKRQTGQVAADLVYHQLHQDGTLAQHAASLGGERISDSAYCQRRALLPQELFSDLLAAGLKPLADPQRPPDAFFKGWRLVGVDGTEVSVTNTPANKTLPKANSRRGKCAFAKLKLVTAMELGLHNPLAAQAGELGDYEVSLALSLWPRLPEHSLVIIDRLYGVAKHIVQMLEAGKGRDLALLVRVRDDKIKTVLVRDLPDGSKLVKIRPSRRAGEKQGEPITLREIQAELNVPGKKSVKVRLWTTLLDCAVYPAEALVRLYAQRWEHELAYRELKLDVRKGDVLDSHTPQTAMQELAAIVLAVAAVARVRACATDILEVPVRRVSLRKLLLATRTLWDAFELGSDFLTTKNKAQMIERYFQRLHREAILPKRRSRHCPRAIRQPVSGWPRLTARSESSGDISITIVQ